MKHGFFLNRLLLLLLLFAAAQSPAQEVRLEPRFSFSLEYSDNMFLQPVVGEDPNVFSDLEPVSDTLWVLTPGLTAGVRGEHASLSLDYDAGHTSYDTYSEFNGWRHDLNFAAAFALPHDLTLSLRHDFLDTETPPGVYQYDLSNGLDIPVTTDPGALNVMEQYTLHTTTAGMTYRPNETDSTFGGGSFSSREGTESSDGYDRRRVLADRAQTTTTGWETHLKGSYNWADFDTGTDLDHWDASYEIGRHFTDEWKWMTRYRHKDLKPVGEAAEEDEEAEAYQVINPEAGISRRAQDGITLDLVLGFYNRIPDGDGNSDSGLSGNINLSKNFDRFGISIFGATGHGEAIYSQDRFDSSTFYTAGAQARYMLSRAMQIGAFTAYRRDDYHDTPDADEQIQDSGSIEESMGVGLNLQYAPREWLAAQLAYQYTDRMQTRNAYEYDESRVILMVTFKLPRKTGQLPENSPSLDMPSL